MKTLRQSLQDEHEVCAGCGGEAGPFSCVWQGEPVLLCPVCAAKLLNGMTKKKLFR